MGFFPFCLDSLCCCLLVFDDKSAVISVAVLRTVSNPTPASCRILSLFIFFSLSMTDLDIVFWYLSYLVFSERPSSVFWCLINFGRFLAIVISNVSSAPFCLFSFWYSKIGCPFILSIPPLFYVLGGYENLCPPPPTIIACSGCFVPLFSFSFSLTFSFWWPVFRLSDAFLGCVQSADELMKAIISVTEFLISSHPSTYIVHCLPFSLEPWACLS